MIVIGLLVWMLIGAVYAALWLALALVLWRVQKHRRLALLEWDGSIAVFALRVVLLAMAFFPLLGALIYIPLYDVTFGSEVLVKPRLIEDASVSSCVAGAIALCASSALWLAAQRRVRATGS